MINKPFMTQAQQEMIRRRAEETSDTCVLELLKYTSFLERESWNLSCDVSKWFTKYSVAESRIRLNEGRPEAAERERDAALERVKVLESFLRTALDKLMRAWVVGGRGESRTKVDAEWMARAKIVLYQNIGSEKEST